MVVRHPDTVEIEFCLAECSPIDLDDESPELADRRDVAHSHNLSYTILKKSDDYITFFNYAGIAIDDAFMRSLKFSFESSKLRLFRRKWASSRNQREGSEPLPPRQQQSSSEQEDTMNFASLMRKISQLDFHKRVCKGSLHIKDQQHEFKFLIKKPDVKSPVYLLQIKAGENWSYASAPGEQQQSLLHFNKNYKDSLPQKKFRS